MIEQYIQYLKNKGLRITQQRKKLLQEIARIDRHFDVDLLLSILKSRKIIISRATIYRTLPLLEEAGMIKEVTRIDNRIFYENVYQKKHHDHMICIECGKIMEFSNDKIEKLQDKICAEYNFRPDKHHLIIYGYCDKCERGKDA